MVTHPIGLSPSLSSGAHPLPYSKLQSSPTFRWLFLAIPCTLTGVSTPEVLLSQIHFRGVWLELPALAMSRDLGLPCWNSANKDKCVC